MATSTPPRDRTQQPWCLYGLARSPADVRESEGRLARERGHRPTLYEVVEDLMAQQHLAAPFTAAATPAPREPAVADSTPP